jgi:CheY-like chemotaxis protein/anti-sigma regulatory factor (Ser/Thr protein kinase)
VSRLFGSFAPYAEHRNVRFIFHYECPHDLTIWADGPKLEKVISNLLSNALKFTPSNGRIVLAVYQEGEALRVEVTDTGAGIAPEDLPHIFDRYYQSKRPNDVLQGGTGIGLSLCKEYARLFGGSLEVQSTVGRGSTFTFVFPLRRPPLAPSVARSAASPAGGQNRKRPGRPSVRPKAPSPTLLIVEDDYNLVRYIQSILEDDYHIVLADNGASALHQLKQHDIELILSDVMMPEMDGFQLLEAVRQQGMDLPFVFLTARIDSTDRMQALRMGVDDYLTKPFLEEELRVRLRNLLERQAVRKATKAELAGQEDEDDALSYDQRWFARLNQVLNDHLSDPDFSVIQMAAAMNTSQRTLQYRTKIYTGLSPVNYLTEFRLDKARQLLESHTYQTVAEVSFLVGFKTPRYFTQIFKKRYGKIPSDL